MDEITNLLPLVGSGDARASDRLFALAYSKLRGMARSRLCGRDLELDATSLVHETYVRLIEHGHVQLKDGSAFYGYMGRVMRSVVIDYVRSQRTLKRGGNIRYVSFGGESACDTSEDARLPALNTALETLEETAPELRSLLDMRYFAGLSIREIARMRGTSTRTVEREWEKARAVMRTLLK